ncbi:hypothetical protein B0H17DRAFT_1040881 [Mycena rosella]|uniref:Uncharacterized protein n=1 Tax=Mycena rosella TaxID=1033263 RepID=A0AAD7GRI8_MYCRO|nr:hypothetical protein B0H17DRAFT_1040881 [Mycena rosella]
MRLAALLHITLIIPSILCAVASDGPTRTDRGLQAQPKKDTNADRLRRGLGPLPPTRRDRKKLSPRASPLPCARLSNNIGTIQVRRLSDGEKLGYLSDRFNGHNAYTVHRRPRAALHVAVPPIAPFGLAINLIAANPPDAGHPYVGAVSNGQGNLGAGEVAVAYLSGTSAVHGSSPPLSSAGTSLILNGHGGIESQVWTMNCQSRQITAQWMNTDNSQPTTTIFYDPVRDYIGLTGDLDAFNAAVAERAYEVTMTFVPVDQ